jgi:predicted mannosyl-3-phosphoglycerate phosphatase (HAD superfamily)
MGGSFAFNADEWKTQHKMMLSWDVDRFALPQLLFSKGILKTTKRNGFRIIKISSKERYERAYH